VAVYTLGMALLTMVMGNAFAAFPIRPRGSVFRFLCCSTVVIRR
jgi:uncharacterized membrane protein